MSISQNVLLGVSVDHTWSDKFGKCRAVQDCLGLRLLTDVPCGPPGGKDRGKALLRHRSLPRRGPAGPMFSKANFDKCTSQLFRDSWNIIARACHFSGQGIMEVMASAQVPPAKGKSRTRLPMSIPGHPHPCIWFFINHKGQGGKLMSDESPP